MDEVPAALEQLARLIRTDIESPGELRRAIFDDSAAPATRKQVMLRLLSEAEDRCGAIRRAYPIDKERQRAAVLSGESIRADLIQVAIWLIEKWSRSGHDLNNAAWEIVVDPHRQRAEYEFAETAARDAVEQLPNDAASLNTLGVAQYRIGRYDVAIESLSKAESLESHATNAIFTAMSKYQLGHLAEARELLEQVKTKSMELDAEDAAFLREAEKLFATPPPPSLPE